MGVEKKALTGLHNKKRIWKDDPERIIVANRGVLYRSVWGTRKVQEKEQGHGQKLSKREAENNPKAGFSAQETKSMNNPLKRKVVLGFADLVTEF